MDIDNEVARAILQHTDEVTIDGRVYKVEQPTLATLIEVSAYASQLPDYDYSGQVLPQVMKNADSAIIVAKIAAMMILGAKRVNQKKRVQEPYDVEEDVFSFLRMRKVRKTIRKYASVLEFDHVARWILNSMQPKDLNEVVMQRLADMQIGDFFALSVSLKGINLTSTREAETARGE